MKGAKMKQMCGLAWVVCVMVFAGSAHALDEADKAELQRLRLENAQLKLQIADLKKDLEALKKQLAAQATEPTKDAPKTATSTDDGKKAPNLAELFKAFPADKYPKELKSKQSRELVDNYSDEHLKGKLVEVWVPLLSWSNRKPTGATEYRLEVAGSRDDSKLGSVTLGTLTMETQIAFSMTSTQELTERLGDIKKGHLIHVRGKIKSAGMYGSRARDGYLSVLLEETTILSTKKPESK